MRNEDIFFEPSSFFSDYNLSTIKAVFFLLFEYNIFLQLDGKIKGIALDSD